MFKSLYVMLLAMFALFSTASNAAITQATHLDPISTEVLADAGTVFGWVLPVFGTILAMTIGIKLIKRFTSKV